MMSNDTKMAMIAGYLYLGGYSTIHDTSTSMTVFRVRVVNQKVYHYEYGIEYRGKIFVDDDVLQVSSVGAGDAQLSMSDPELHFNLLKQLGTSNHQIQLLEVSGVFDV